MVEAKGAGLMSFIGFLVVVVAVTAHLLVGWAVANLLLRRITVKAHDDVRSQTLFQYGGTKVGRHPVPKYQPGTENYNLTVRSYIHQDILTWILLWPLRLVWLGIKTLGGRMDAEVDRLIDTADPSLSLPLDYEKIRRMEREIYGEDKPSAASMQQRNTRRVHPEEECGR